MGEAPKKLYTRKVGLGCHVILNPTVLTCHLTAINCVVGTDWPTFLVLFLN